MNVDKLLVEAGAYFGGDGINYDRFEPHKFAALVLATTPPQRTWVGLTDEEILAVNMSTVTKLIDEPIVCDTDHNIVQLGKAIEAKLKEKNA